ncbi:MAG: DUF348 domain-containing protein, partial [Clostridia bacterium]|nr:DUF348 domain-containing protein [Clostridia bacterium]
MNNRDKFTALRSRIKQFGKRELALVTKTLTTAGVFCMAGYMAVSMGQFAHRVTITCDGQPMQITTFRNDAASILAQSRVEYDDTHEILCRYNDGNLVEIIVNSAPDVTVVADGVSYPVAIHNGTVADALCFAGVTLGEMDAADHALTDPLTDDMVIRVQRVEKVVTTETVVIEHGTEEVKSALDKKGTRKVVRKGK